MNLIDKDTTDRFFNALWYWQFKSDHLHFVAAFGHVGTHLWNQFTHKYNGDLLRFSKSLDSDNLTKLKEMVFVHAKFSK